MSPHLTITVIALIMIICLARSTLELYAQEQTLDWLSTPKYSAKAERLMEIVAEDCSGS